MQSNRESARRSRRRKQAQLNERETQVAQYSSVALLCLLDYDSLLKTESIYMISILKVGQLRDERSSLLSRFTDVNQKCDAASVDNRILKADIETLRAKVSHLLHLFSCFKDSCCCLKSLSNPLSASMLQDHDV